MRRPGIVPEIIERSRRGDFFVENDRVAEFQDRQAEKKPEGERVNIPSRPICSADFIARILACRPEIKNAISTGRLPARGLPAHWCAATAAFVPWSADFPTPAGRDPAGDGFRAGIAGNFSRFSAGGQRVQPDVAQPPLDEHQQIRALTAIFRFNGRRQLVLPFFAQILFHLVVFFQRRTRGQCFVHARTDFAEFLQQHVEQPVAAQQAFLFRRPPARRIFRAIPPAPRRARARRRRKNSGAGSATKSFPISATVPSRAESRWNFPAVPPAF